MAEYFEEVWGFLAGRSFVYLAPLNSIASRINGFTLHAWGEIAWNKASASGDMRVQSGNNGTRNMSSMGAKTEVCRWIFILEVEAVGAEILGVLEENTTESARRNG